MDPNPFKHRHPAVDLKRVRSAIEPSLSAAGFVFQGRNNPYPGTPVFLYLDYARGQEELRVAWDRREDDQFIGFTAEFLSKTGELIIIATCALSGVPAIPKHSRNAFIQSQIDAFTKQIEEFLDRQRTVPEA